MKKFAVFSATIFISILLAGIYGILHDQITYAISPEYFTKFKYVQFGFEPQWFGGHRQTVAVIGFLATWWTGLFVGMGLGLTALIFKDHKKMRKALQKAILVTFCFAILLGVLGFFYGRFVLTKTGVDWWFPDNLVDTNAFITVGSIHNFSYLGGLLGLVAGIYYLLRLNKQQNGGAIESV
jgi:hypothetical protein